MDSIGVRILSVKREKKGLVYFFKRAKEAPKMKGYYTANGFYGLVGNTYVLFSDETDYYEYLEDAAA